VNSGAKATDSYLVCRPLSTREAELAIRGSSQSFTTDYVEVWTLSYVLRLQRQELQSLEPPLSPLCDRGHNYSVFQRVRIQPMRLILTLELLWLKDYRIGGVRAEVYGCRAAQELALWTYVG
jgi:hypothetical protein